MKRGDPLLKLERGPFVRRTKNLGASVTRDFDGQQAHGSGPGSPVPEGLPRRPVASGVPRSELVEAVAGSRDGPDLAVRGDSVDIDAKEFPHAVVDA
jgi:hypothetical protein